MQLINDILQLNLVPFFHYCCLHLNALKEHLSKIQSLTLFGEENITSGASSDIFSASKIAKVMVTKYGFSKDVRIMYHGEDTEEESMSVNTQSNIYGEVKSMMKLSYNMAKELLKKYALKRT